MDPWVVWVVVGVVLLVAEATTTALVPGYFGVAALLAGVLALLGLAVAVQLIAFGVLAVGALVLTRPALRRSMTRGSGLRTGVDAMQGKIGVITVPIAELEPGRSRSAVRRGPPAASTTASRSPSARASRS